MLSGAVVYCFYSRVEPNKFTFLLKVEFWVQSHPNHCITNKTESGVRGHLHRALWLKDRVMEVN